MKIPHTEKLQTNLIIYPMNSQYLVEFSEELRKLHFLLC